MYKKIFTSIIIALSFISADALAQKGQVSKKIYCWEDETGKRVCSDAPQPESNKYDKTAISSKTGLKVGEIERQLTAEEIEQRRVEEEMARVEMERAEKIKRNQMRILQRYQSVDDINTFFDIKRDEIEKNIALSEKNIKPMHKQLVAKLSKVGELELEGKKISAKLHEEILKSKTQLDKQKQYIIERRNDLKVLQREREEEISIFQSAKQKQDYTLVE